MTTQNIPIIFSTIIQTNRKPKILGDFDYIDISFNTICDISSNIIYDTSSNIIFYKLQYYELFLINCINNVYIVTKKDNYVYLFLLDLSSNQIPICKIGYTSDILNRTLSLKLHTNIQMLLLAIMPIKGQFQEKDLHIYLKIKCPYCIMDYKYPNGSNATELYKLHPVLIKELYSYIKYLELNNRNNLLIIQEETKQIEYIEKTKQIEYIEKTKQEQEKTKQLKLQLQILKLEIKNKK
jgi:hypothetical protein